MSNENDELSVKAWIYPRVYGSGVQFSKPPGFADEDLQPLVRLADAQRIIERMRQKHWALLNEGPEMERIESARQQIEAAVESHKLSDAARLADNALLTEAMIAVEDERDRLRAENEALRHATESRALKAENERARRQALEDAAQEAVHWQRINPSHQCGAYIAGAIRALAQQEKS